MSFRRPQPGDPVLSIKDLKRFAREFDDISREQEAHYSAAAFVRFIQAELESRYQEPAGRPGRRDEPILTVVATSGA